MAGFYEVVHTFRKILYYNKTKKAKLLQAFSRVIHTHIYTFLMVTSDACISRFFGYNCKSRTAVARDIHPYYRVQIPPRLQNHQNTSNIALKDTRCRQRGKQFFYRKLLFLRKILYSFQKSYK